MLRKLILQKRSSDDEEDLREVEEKNRWLLQIVEICSLSLAYSINYHYSFEKSLTFEEFNIIS